MKRILAAGACLLLAGSILFAQADGAARESGGKLTMGTNGMLGVEAGTTFGWDFNDNSTGLETKIGLELVIDLFPAATRGITPVNTDTPSVRLEIENCKFTWWNNYSVTGVNYEQYAFNEDVESTAAARQLYLTFDSITSDVVWKNYFFRVAGTETEMRNNKASIRSIFDDAMDTDGRIYASKSLALYSADRYNALDLPLLEKFLYSDEVDVDYRTMSGQLAAGGEWEKISFAVKAASYKKGVENNDNAWIFGADVTYTPTKNIKIEANGLAGVNYEKAVSPAINEVTAYNPYSASLGVDWVIPVTEKIYIKPFAGVDYLYIEPAVGKPGQRLEAGLGTYVYFRGLDYKSAYSVIDYDEVIPAGLSVSANITLDNVFNVCVSVFDAADKDALIPNLGGFIQLELGNILKKEIENDYNENNLGIAGQLEYNIGGKILPYIFGMYRPEIAASGVESGKVLMKAAVGSVFTPFNNFSVELRYELKGEQELAGEMTWDKGVFTTTCTIKM